jgi:hypothetical protein
MDRGGRFLPVLFRLCSNVWPFLERKGSSLSFGKRKNDSLVLIVDYRINDHMVVVPVKISTEANSNQVLIDVNRMASA